jgi:hypothetical protein
MIYVMAHGYHKPAIISKLAYRLVVGGSFSFNSFFRAELNRGRSTCITVRKAARRSSVLLRLFSINL